MTVHMISVGLSVLDTFADPARKLAPKKDLVAAIARSRPADLLDDAGIGARDSAAASRWVTTALGREKSPPREALREAVLAVRPAEWPRSMSAETETFGLVQNTSGFSLSRRDTAVFICSDTPPGLLAGLWNALAVVGGDIERVRYIPAVPDADDGGDQLGDLRRHAVVVRVTQMDASNSKQFAEAMGQLGLLARHLFRSGTLARDEEFRFLLSGGFKAAIPYLIGLAEAVRSVDDKCLEDLGRADLMPRRSPWPAKAYVLHETAYPDTPADKAIELPLRRLPARAVRSELTEWKGTQRTGKPGNALLDGYAYDVLGGPAGREDCNLTAFGVGLRALFGLSREGLGG